MNFLSRIVNLRSDLKIFMTCRRDSIPIFQLGGGGLNRTCTCMVSTERLQLFFFFWRAEGLIVFGQSIDKLGLANYTYS